MNYILIIKMILRATVIYSVVYILINLYHSRQYLLDYFKVEDKYVTVIADRDNTKIYLVPDLYFYPKLPKNSLIINNTLNSKGIAIFKSNSKKYKFYVLTNLPYINNIQEDICIIDDDALSPSLTLKDKEEYKSILERIYVSIEDTGDLHIAQVTDEKKVNYKLESYNTYIPDSLFIYLSTIIVLNGLIIVIQNEFFNSNFTFIKELGFRVLIYTIIIPMIVYIFSILF